jgi:hypothetical protein
MENAVFPNKWLLAALTITAALTLWTSLQEDATEGEVVVLADNRSKALVESNNKQSKQQENIRSQHSVIAWQKLKRSSLQDPIENPFKVHSWLVVPPVKKVNPASLPPPTAPSAPFTYLGKYEETPANTQIFLLANGKLYSVTQGKNIDSQWRLDGEDINSLHLTFLPLNLPQVLSKATRAIMPVTEPINAEMNL